MSAKPPKPPDGGGYKSPPHHSRFKKGQSGNPSGKRKATEKEAAQDDLEVVLSQLVPTMIGGKRVKITARRALYQRLLVIGLQGDVKAIGLLLKFKGLNDNKPGSLPQAERDEQEMAVIARYLARKAKRSGGSGD